MQLARDDIIDKSQKGPSVDTLIISLALPLPNTSAPIFPFV